MDRYRLKRIIILILLFLNIALSISILSQKFSERSAQKTAAEQLSSLFAADGMHLDPLDISKSAPPARRSVAHDPAMEERVAQSLLGEIFSVEDQGGGIRVYSGNTGTVYFRSGGDFEAILNKPIADGLHFCSEFSKTFSLSAPTVSLDASNSGTVLALPEREHLIVYNAPTTFSLMDGQITAVSGTLIAGSSAMLPEQEEMLSAIAALTAFQYSRQETGSVVSAILGTELCWEFQNLSGNMVLVPSWQISTNTAAFYVNCLTGVVRRS